eukprot:g3860.t1
MISIVRLAILSRVLVWVLAILARVVLDPYDSSNEITIRSDVDHTDAVRYLAIHDFGNWDGVHFMGIAERGGYEHEHSYAFFPLLPAIAHVTSRPFVWAGILDAAEALRVAAFLVSNACFVASACLLDVLGKRTLGRSKRAKATARVAAMLFCFTPAGIFMSAAYTESIFSFLSFAGMIRASQGCVWTASTMFFLAAATRSNGAILSLFYIGLPALVAASHRVFASSTWKHAQSRAVAARRFVSILFPAILPALLPFIPFVCFQAHAGRAFCQDHDVNEAVHDDGSISRPWCDLSSYSPPLRLASVFMGGVPLGMYGWIQATYWGNGFLSYWQVKQIPNFLLATPIACFSCLGFDSYRRQRYTSRRDCEKVVNVTPYGRVDPPYVLHWFVLLIVAVLTMNVQVTTRFLSSCPALYWYAADCVTSAPQPRRKHRLGALLSYSLVYTALGTVLFCRFYPWT